MTPKFILNAVVWSLTFAVTGFALAALAPLAPLTFLIAGGVFAVGGPLLTLRLGAKHPYVVYYLGGIGVLVLVATGTGLLSVDGPGAFGIAGGLVLVALATGLGYLHERILVDVSYVGAIVNGALTGDEPFVQARQKALAAHIARRDKLLAPVVKLFKKRPS